jgi:ABC-type amino acid transport substrate-binding protein
METNNASICRCFRRSVKALTAAALALCLLEPVLGQSSAFVVPYTGTLKKVNESGVLRIGYRENSPPFAFLDPKGKPIGYALDLCAVVVEEIVAELRKDIRVEYRPVTPEKPLRSAQLGRESTSSAAPPPITSSGARSRRSRPRCS